MPLIKKAAVIGGDERSCVCANMFLQNGTECAVFGLEKSKNGCCATRCVTIDDALCGSDILILPLPALDGKYIHMPLSDKKITVDELARHTPPETIIFSGTKDRNLYSTFKNRIVCFSEDEIFQISGSISTSEGALKTAIGKTGKTILHSDILVCGNGRIGKYLSSMLKSLGANVYVSARKDTDLALIDAKGCVPVHTTEIKNSSVAFDIIFNTVPHMILDKSVLRSLKGKPVIIELASKPYGIDFEAADKLGITVIKAHGLPGAIAPADAGKAMYESVIRLLAEMEEET